MNDIKFYYKEKSFSCGPCALRMVLETLLDTPIEEEKIIKLIGATAETGTSLSLFRNNLSPLLKQIAIEFKIDSHFEFLIKEHSNFKELKDLQKANYLIMLNYKKPDHSPHWAVLKAINQKSIILMDPNFGPNFSYKKSQFNWSGGINIPTHKAFIAIKIN